MERIILLYSKLNPCSVVESGKVWYLFHFSGGRNKGGHHARGGRGSQHLFGVTAGRRALALLTLYNTNCLL
jgi:hypothetical protein